MGEIKGIILPRPFCQQCGDLQEIWLGLDGQLRYVCPRRCLILNYGANVQVVLNQKIEPAGKPYINNCWNCESFIDSRLPHLCPRDSEDHNDLFCCPNCGESMKKFPGPRPNKK